MVVYSNMGPAAKMSKPMIGTTIWVNLKKVNAEGKKPDCKKCLLNNSMCIKF